jgi:serine/threonine protein kinase
MHEPSREMRIPEDLATAVDAVRRLHRAGIAHGDIKPAHIRIREDGSVMLIDFGTATPATVASRERDLRRLLEMAVLGARSPRAQWLLRAARACRGSAASAAALRLASPWWRRRAALRGCVAAVLLAVLVAVLAAGWQAWRASTRQADAFAALAATGRLVDATVDSSGRLIGLRLDVPEMAALYSDSPGRTILISRIRFDSDGGLTIFDVDGHPMSR